MEKKKKKTGHLLLWLDEGGECELVFNVHSSTHLWEKDMEPHLLMDVVAFNK